MYSIILQSPELWGLSENHQNVTLMSLQAEIEGLRVNVQDYVFGLYLDKEWFMDIKNV